ncbi:MAG: hypothetical protein KC418_04755 [Anaerolineales bacterium]|nr:hypothetical protein [Anaerolineales bacterium]MCB8952207.1 hypothetical protein [Ardenticatenales bacterium]
MTMWNLRQKLQRAIQAVRGSRAQDEAAAAQVARLTALARMVAQTEEDDYGCGDVYELIDQYAESVLRGSDPTVIMPKVKKHLDQCRGCCEEYQILLQILQMEGDS